MIRESGKLGFLKMADWFTYAVLTSLLWGCIPVLEKTGVQGMDNLFAAALLRASGAIMGAVLIPVFSPSALKAIVSAPPKAYVCLMAAGFLGSFVGQLTNLNALKLGDVTKVVPVTASWPLLAMIAAFILLGEPVTAKKIGAVVLVVSGVILARV